MTGQMLRGRPWFGFENQPLKILSALSVCINEKNIQPGNWESCTHPGWLLTQESFCWKGCYHT